MQVAIKKEDFDNFIKQTASSYDVYAPVSGNTQKKVQRSEFEKVTSSERIKLGVNTYFPAKNFFFDKREVIFNFNGNQITDSIIKLRDRVIFGLRKCDLNGIKHQDIVFLEDKPDPFYKFRREATILIGVHCKEGDEYCFCNSFKHDDFYDLMFYEQEDKYVIETGSEKGEQFLQQFDFLEDNNEVIDKKTTNVLELSTTEIKDLFDNKGWKDLSDTCLSCGACNHLCPNCHCFTIQDDVNFDLKSGQRIRVPASCQLREFTRVAGDHVFRDVRVERFKHRIYHQIEYFRDRHGMEFCTGCGRCIRGCPVKIDWVTKINEMKGAK